MINPLFVLQRMLSQSTSPSFKSEQLPDLDIKCHKSYFPYWLKKHWAYYYHITKKLVPYYFQFSSYDNSQYCQWRAFVKYKGSIRHKRKRTLIDIISLKHTLRYQLLLLFKHNQHLTNQTNLANCFWIGWLNF